MQKSKFHNITIDEFFKSADVSEYETFMRWLTPKNSINEKSCDFNELTFAEVARVRKLLYEPNIENVLELYEILYKIKPDDLLKCGVLELFQTNRYILNKITELNEREKLLGANFTEAEKLKWIASGGKRLSQFEEMGQMISLGKMFSKSPEEIGNWKYNTVYITLLYNNISDDVNKRMSQIKT